MENLIAYLDESLVPLERKVKEYLDLEREIRLLEVKIVNLQNKVAASETPEMQDTMMPDERSQEALLGEDEKLMEALLQRYEEMKEEIINMLPEQNKFIEINLGYGPSMVGYFTVDHETHQELPEPVLRVVH